MNPSLDIRHGDVIAELRRLPPRSVHCVVTSPPYWGLRDYKIPSSVWGGDEACAHEFGESGRSHQRQRNGAAGGIHAERSSDKLTANITLHPSTGATCTKCGAWRGCHGLEPTPELFVQHEVLIFAKVWRVLRDDGTLWLNLGDSYATNGGAHQAGSYDGFTGRGMSAGQQRTVAAGLKPKDLCGIPWRVALALQAAGWYLRSDIIWHKPNPMPESVTDRPTKSHEYIFLLTKREKYFYDAEAVNEPMAEASADRYAYSFGGAKSAALIEANKTGVGQQTRVCGEREATSRRNKRSVWTVATQPYSEAHFATFPPDLIRPCILAGTSAKGCCPACGAPWERITEKVATGGTQKMPDGMMRGKGTHGSIHPDGREKGETGVPVTANQTTGWRPTCACGCDDVLPAVVLDPFGGSGTTGQVALEYGRHAILIEIGDHHIPLIRDRCDVPPVLNLH